MEFYVLKEIIVFLISFVIFQSITISFGEYLLVLDLIWGVLLYFLIVRVITGSIERCLLVYWGTG